MDPYLSLIKVIIIKLDCDFIITPRILFNDKNLSRTDIDILRLIISLTFKYGYCYACNDKLAKYVTTSIRTLSDSLSKLRKLNYIIVKSEYKNNYKYYYKKFAPVPKWIDDPSLCEPKLATPEEQAVMEELLKEFKK